MNLLNSVTTSAVSNKNSRIEKSGNVVFWAAKNN